MYSYRSKTLIGVKHKHFQGNILNYLDRKNIYVEK